MAGWPFMLSISGQYWNMYDCYIVSSGLTIFNPDNVSYEVSNTVGNGIPMGPTGQPLIIAQSWRNANSVWVTGMKLFRYTWTETEP